MKRIKRTLLWAFSGGAIIAVVLEMARDCNSAMVKSAVASASAVSCGEFWLNRYQTLLASIIAIAGAWLTIRTMMRQTEMARADDADRRLARYAHAMINLMQRQAEAKPPERPDALEAARLFKKVDIASDDSAIREAMTDGVMGEDSKMVALFAHVCRNCALAKIYEHPDPPNESMVSPLYLGLANAIRRRQSMLRSGQKVSDLQHISIIDQTEIEAAYADGRPPKLD